MMITGSKLAVQLLLLQLLLVGWASAIVTFDFTYAGYSSTGYCGSPTPSPTYRTCIHRVPQCDAIIDRFRSAWSMDFTVPSSLQTTASWSVDSGSVSSVSSTNMDYSVNFGIVGYSDLKFTTTRPPTGAYWIRFLNCVNISNPVVTSVTGNESPEAGGALLTIVGQYFGDASITSLSVNLGSSACTVVSWTGTQIVVSTPALSAGSYPLNLIYPPVTVLAHPAIMVGVRVSYPLSSYTSLPFNQASTVSIYGIYFVNNIVSYTLTAVSGATGSIIATSVAGNSIVNFSMGPTQLGPVNTRSTWVFTYLGQTLGTIYVLSSPYAIVRPYSIADTIQNSLGGALTSPVPVMTRFVRFSQDLVHMQFDDIMSFNNPGSSLPLQLSTPIPAQYRPIRTIRCYSHISVNGVATELKADINTDGSVVFGSDLGGSTWMTSGTIYFNGCSWITPA